MTLAAPTGDDSDHPPTRITDGTGSDAEGWQGSNERREMKVTRDNGRCVIVPVSLAGLTALWAIAVALLVWGTVGGPTVVGQWGLLCSAGAAAWTVIYGLARQHRLLQRAFDLGKEAKIRGV